MTWDNMTTEEIEREEFDAFARSSDDDQGDTSSNDQQGSSSDQQQGSGGDQQQGSGGDRSHQALRDNGLCPPGHHCACTSGVFHDYDATDRFSAAINNGCTSDKG